MLLRRSLLLTGPALVVLPRMAVPQTLDDLLDKNGRDRNGKRLGDDGFLHDFLHSSYQKYFPLQDCPCHDGECRPTTWRRNPEDRNTLQAFINNKWVSADTKTKIRDRKAIPFDFPSVLLNFDAHACAYGIGPNTTLTCLWILNANV